ncbi:MAG: hypothetical protein K8M05_29685, partial [Deltaproteobacteria bacterium]|nr:hypothetical protein [Kofleriaceae bacterium]
MRVPHSLRISGFAATLLAVAATAGARPAKPTPVPGAVGLVQRDVPLRNACAATFTEIKKTKRGDDPAFVAALTHARLTGLDLNPANERRHKADLKKFETWFQNLTRTAEKATKAQYAIISDASSTPQAKVEAAARVAILLEHVALVIESSEIPRHVRATPEAAEVYCDTLAEKTEPLHEQARQARDACARLASEAKLAAGWHTAVCTRPA